MQELNTSYTARKILSKVWHLPIIQTFIPDKSYLKLQYKNFTGNRLNLSNPKSFNEKLQWLKLYNRNPLYTDLVDKIKVREHISSVVGNEYLVPIIGIYDSFEEINFDALPKQFVLKPNHTSGDVFICKDKSKIDFLKLKKEINSWLRKRYYLVHREWPYKDIKPKIICEEYLTQENGKELLDYKFMCFNGEVKCSFVCLNRNSSEGLNIDFYNLDWEKMPFKRHYPNSTKVTPKPKHYNQMIEFAQKLSKDIPFVRVDFYETNDRLYFGELTFFPGSGYEKFSPESYDHLLGSWLKLPTKY
ncbi:ATP-grasp fold amidoligase family protein [Bacillus sp. EB01]|uniref:ATP-grasp fold amidoligase family protein n=1 Tax=Bacillus sp. EB01 TaxID=1347086 RepID=UPI000ACBB847|nr:ATP-grasp fold amidoligase family protein [Bacillus sp. EB01]